MLCKVYHDRPDICRVDVQYERNYRQQMNWKTFCDLNVAACELIRQIEQEKHPILIGKAAT